MSDDGDERRCCGYCDVTDHLTELDYFKKITPDTLTVEHLEELYELMCEFGPEQPELAHSHEVRAMRVFVSKLPLLSHEEALEIAAVLKKINDLKFPRWSL